MNLKNARILEIGCGYGAFCETLAESGAKVDAVEIDKKKADWANNHFDKNENIKIRIVTDEILPYKNNSFDSVILFDVIEHVNKPEITIKEAHRVLKKNGILYVEFTPYYSPAGHHLYDFAKWPIHILPEETIKKYVYSKKIRGFLTSDDFWQQFKSLNKLKISDFQSMVKKFKTIDERYIVKYPDIFEISIPQLKFLGKLKDIFTMSFEGTYSKK